MPSQNQHDQSASPATRPNPTVRVLLLGDSTVLGSVPRLVAPHADHLEDIVRKLLAGDAALPPVVVINKGEDNDTIQRMLSERYERDVAKLQGGAVDFVFIRFGINDRSYLADWRREFPQTYHQLIAQIRRDQPRALITLETIIPYRDEASTAEVNTAIRTVAAEEKLPVLDTHARYAEALKQGINTLNYRRAPLSVVPARFQSLVPPQCVYHGDVILLDNTLDPQLGNVPGWFNDRHPNLAGFHVIGGALADFLAPLIHRRIESKP